MKAAEEEDLSFYDIDVLNPLFFSSSSFADQ